MYFPDAKHRPAAPPQPATRQPGNYDTRRPWEAPGAGAPPQDLDAPVPQLVQSVQILHQTGKENFLEVEKLSRAALLDVPVSPEHVPLRYQAVPYFEGGTAMADALSAADLVVSRSGSNIFEFAAFGKPVILIPLEESANGHQAANAYAFAEHGAGIVIEEANLLPDIFLTQVRTVLEHPETLERMKMASKSFFLANAGERLAEEILALTA